MKTKYALAAALAHEPELLVMDEPTSGLDPVFRREVLSILSDYIGNGERTVLFSTHISADLERIADYMVYMRDGRLRYSGSKEDLLDRYWLVRGPSEWLRKADRPLIGLQQTALGFEGLLPKSSIASGSPDQRIILEKPSLDDILVFTKEGM